VIYSTVVEMQRYDPTCIGESVVYDNQL
jgi:hypothetical protein